MISKLDSSSNRYQRCRLDAMIYTVKNVTYVRQRFKQTLFYLISGSTGLSYNDTLPVVPVYQQPDIENYNSIRQTTQYCGMCLEFNRSKRVKYGLILCASWMKGDKLFTGTSCLYPEYSEKKLLQLLLVLSLLLLLLQSLLLLQTLLLLLQLLLLMLLLHSPLII